jgi:hypothetical protein
MNAFTELFSGFHQKHAVKTRALSASGLDVEEREDREKDYRVNKTKHTTVFARRQSPEKKSRGIVNHKVNMNLNLDPTLKNIKVTPPKDVASYMVLSEFTNKLDYDALNAVKEMAGLPQYKLGDDLKKYSLGNRHSTFSNNNSPNGLQVNFNLNGNFAPQVAPSRFKGTHNEMHIGRNARELPINEQSTLEPGGRTNTGVIKESERPIARSAKNMDENKSHVSQRDVPVVSRGLAVLMVPNQGGHGQILQSQREMGHSQADRDIDLRVRSKKRMRVKTGRTSGGKNNK